MKCIKYFRDFGIICYGNFATDYMYIPITFKTLKSRVIMTTDIQKWEEAYNQRESILEILKGDTDV